MANYCQNRLKVSGEPKQLKNLLGKLGKDLDFNKVVPMPKGYDKNEKWYAWCIDNWGCKWSPYDGSINIEDDGVEDGYAYLDFDTPWSPPTEFIKNASKKYPKLVFILRYEEEGCGFYGVAKAKNGELEDYTIEE